MDTGKFLIILIGIVLAYDVIMKGLNVLDNLINTKRYSLSLNRNRNEIDIDEDLNETNIDEDFKDII